MSSQQGARGFPAGEPKYATDSLFAQLKCGGRLSLSSTLAVPTSDITAASAVYLLPHEGGAAPIYTRTGWRLLPFAAQTFTLAGLTSGKNYDFFDVDKGDGTITCELAPAWTSDTARATTADVADQDGHKLNASGFSGLLTGRSVPPGAGRLRGTIRTTSTTTTEDSDANRLVANAYNPVRRRVRLRPGYVDNNTTTTFNHSSTTFSTLNGGTGATAGFVVLNKIVPDLTMNAVGEAAAQWIMFGIGIDSTTSVTNAAGNTSGYRSLVSLRACPILADGYHTASMLAAVSGGTVAVFTDVERLGSATDQCWVYLEGTVMT